MAVALVNTSNITDDASLELQNGAATLGALSAVTTAVVGGTTYVFATGFVDDGVSVLSLAANGTLAAVGGTGNVDDTEGPGETFLDGAVALTTAVLNGVTYLFVAGKTDDGVSVFSVAANGQLTTVDNETGTSLNGAAAVTTVAVGGNTFLYTAGSESSNLTRHTINANTGALSSGVAFQSGAAFQFDGMSALHSAVIGGTSFLFVAGTDESGISVFSVDAAGSIANTDNAVDGGPRELAGVIAITTAQVAGKTFLIAAGAIDNGLSVFQVSAAGILTNVFNVTDDATLKLQVADALATAVIAGTTYLFVASNAEDAVTVFGVAPDGALVRVAEIADAGLLELDGASGLSTTVIDGKTFLVVAGQADSGLSVFRVDATGLTINGTAGNDTINAVKSAPGQLAPGALGDTIKGLAGNDNLSGLGGPDILIGGSGRDSLTGGSERDLFDFNSKNETKVGSANRDVIQDFKRGTDDIDLRTIDAKTGIAGNNVFKFIGTDAFNDVKGELRLKDLGSKVIVQGDVNGNGTADFEILVKAGSLAKADFLL